MIVGTIEIIHGCGCRITDACASDYSLDMPPTGTDTSKCREGHGLTPADLRLEPITGTIEATCRPLEQLP